MIWWIGAMVTVAAGKVAGYLEATVEVLQATVESLNRLEGDE